jgi:hypothetical protein
MPTHALPTLRAGGAARSTSRSLARIGAVAALVGALVLLVSTLLHPLGADPHDAPAPFAEYAVDSLWVRTHLGQFLGFALLAVALVARASTFDQDRAAAWGRIGLAGAGATIATAASLQAVDGIALKVLVDRWADTTGDTRELAYQTPSPCVRSRSASRVC